MTTGREARIPLPGDEGRARRGVDEHLQAEVARLDAVNATLRDAPPGDRDAGEQRWA